MSDDGSRVLVVWDESYTEYNFGPSHPMHPLRLDLTAKLIQDLGIFDLARVQVEEPPIASDAELGTVHEARFVEQVRACELDDQSSEEVRAEFGLGTEEVPRFDRLHEASARIFGGTLTAARAIGSGRVRRAVNFGGGMHHAKAAKAGGFCVYNDLAGGIRHLLDSGFERVAYIDMDAHHGDGTESIFWDDPRVLTISLHESGRFLYPGTGFADEIGGLHAAASAANIALPAITGDADWLRAFDAVVPPLVAEFAPQVIVSQHGCDGHRGDPLTHLRLSVDSMRQAAVRIRELSEAHAEGRWLATGGGGYELVDVVPRAWANLVAVAADADIPADREIPARWREHVHELTGRNAPVRMGEGGDVDFQPWSSGYDPESELDRAVMKTRKNVFPLLGLDPHFD